jgi:hypothetical protein
MISIKPLPKIYRVCTLRGSVFLFTVSVRLLRVNTRALFAGIRRSFADIRALLTGTRELFADTRQSLADTRELFAGIRQSLAGARESFRNAFSFINNLKINHL